ncbi:MAG: GNAT family N-acetyltransferase [Pseudomonadota bacterium]
MDADTPTFTLRQASAGDADTLAHIGVATFVDSYTTDISGQAMVAHCTQQHAPAAYAAYLADDTNRCWIAEYAETGAPVGYAVNCAPDLPVDVQPGDLELKRIYVLSRFHGAGLGLRLLEAALGHAREAGAQRLLLGTYEENHRAMAFYRRHGFQQIGTRQFNVGGTIYDDIVMARPV